MNLPQCLAWIFAFCGVAAMVLPPRLLFVDCMQNGTLALFRRADDAAVVKVFWAMWWSLALAATCLCASAGFHFMAVMRQKLRGAALLVLHIPLWVFVFYMALPLFRSYAPDGDTKRDMLYNPVADWAYCGRTTGHLHRDLTSAKVWFGFNYDYSGGVVLQPPPAARVVAHAGVPVEVVHSPDAPEFASAWHYVMPGTGVYANFSRIATYGSHDEFAAAMGLPCTTYQCLERLAEAFQRAARLGYDAVQFTSHEDQTCGSMYAELVALVPGESSCPIQYLSADGRPCACDPALSTSNCGTPINTADKYAPPLALAIVPIIIPSVVFFVFSCVSGHSAAPRSLLLREYEDI